MANEAKNSKWNEDSHRAMCGALLDVLEAGTVALFAHKEVVVQSMEQRGHPFTWEGIRYVSELSFNFFNQSAICIFNHASFKPSTLLKCPFYHQFPVASTKLHFQTPIAIALLKLSLQSSCSVILQNHGHHP